MVFVDGVMVRRRSDSVYASMSAVSAALRNLDPFSLDHNTLRSLSLSLIHLMTMTGAPSTRVLLPNSDSSNSLDGSQSANNSNSNNIISSKLRSSKENSSPLLSSSNSNGFLSSTPSSKLLNRSHLNASTPDSRIEKLSEIHNPTNGNGEDHKGSWKSWKRGEGLQQWELELIGNSEVKRKANVAQLC